jgi:hypothetical protein
VPAYKVFGSPYDLTDETKTKYLIREASPLIFLAAHRLLEVNQDFRLSVLSKTRIDRI